MVLQASPIFLTEAISAITVRKLTIQKMVVITIVLAKTVPAVTAKTRNVRTLQLGSHQKYIAASVTAFSTVKNVTRSILKEKRVSASNSRKVLNAAKSIN